MQVSLSSLQTSFLVSPVVAVHLLSQHRVCLYHAFLLLRLGAQHPLCVYHFSFGDIQVWGRCPRGRLQWKETATFLSSSGLFLLHRATNGSDIQDGVWQQHCWVSLFNTSLAVGWSCGSSRTPESRVKGQILCVFSGGCIPWEVSHAQRGEVCTSLHQKAVTESQNHRIAGVGRDL